MKRTSIHSFIVGVTGLVLLVGCGGPQNENTLGSQHAATAGEGLAAMAEGTVSYFNLDEPLGAPDLRQRPRALAGTAPALMRRFSGAATPAASSECYTIVGDPSDADLDGIPADLRATFDCYFEDGDNNVTLTGAEFIRDTEPTKAAFALQAGKDDLYLAAVTPDEQVSIREDAFVVASEVGPRYTLSVDDAVSVNASRGEETHAFTGSESVIASLNTATRNVTIDGSWEVTADDAFAAATLNTAPTVHYNPMCITESQIDAGAIEATWTDGVSNATLRIEWLSCGKARITFNGEVVGDNT